jgi:hypothetical protein
MTSVKLSVSPAPVAAIKEKIGAVGTLSAAKLMHYFFCGGSGGGAPGIGSTAGGSAFLMADVGGELGLIEFGEDVAVMLSVGSVSEERRG